MTEDRREALWRRIRQLLIPLTGAAIAVALAPAPAHAAGVGYVRLAHLSPDTPEVDVYLNPVGGGKQQVFPGVGYGVVSQYLSLPVGQYTVSMRQAGAAASTPPVISTAVPVQAGKAYTVAGTGLFAGLGLKVLSDDLSLPAGGKAKVRIVQASVKASTLDVSLSNGESIGTGVAFASTTDYRVAAPGQWQLTVKPGSSGTPTEIACTLEAGNVYSLIVLDKAGGGLSAELRKDAGRNGPIPQGGVETGAAGSRYPMMMWAGVGGAALLAAAGVLALAAARRRRTVWR